MSRASARRSVAWIFGVTSVVAGLACACNDLVGVEDVSLRAEEPQPGEDAGADVLPRPEVDATIDSRPLPMDSGPEVEASEPACAQASRVIYRFKDATGAYVLSQAVVAPANFTAEGAVFRLFPGDAGAPTKLLYESRNATNGDHLPTAAATEGAPAYTSPNALGFMLASAAPGTVALVRYYRQLPALRHLASVRAADVPADFLPEFIIGQVCPP